jgi:thiol-disulfide isomerase/thioredoxin
MQSHRQLPLQSGLDRAVERLLCKTQSPKVNNNMNLHRRYIALLILFASTQLAAQQTYTLGSAVKDFPIKKIINQTTTATQFSQLQKNITIIDFFGTWCAPCIKALPHLQALQQQFGNQVSIVLLSTEDEKQLRSFIAKNKQVTLPIIVDEGENIASLFQPPSYPYTIVLNKQGTIISTGNAASLTASDIEKWLAVKETAPTKKEVTTPPIVKENKPMPAPKIEEANALVKLSQNFMYAAKTNAATETFMQQLQNLTIDSLQQQLTNDDVKKAFWINLYNGYTQYFLKKNKEAYSSRNKFFKAKQINIAGKQFSLDDIEHGILRRSKIKWSEGYLNKLFPNKTEKKLRVHKLDYRLHFALNCGAASCPPIAFYSSNKIDEQLTLATKAFLTADANYDTATNTLYLPKLMSWFRKDFGGKKNMRALAKQLSIVPADKNPSIKFKPYSWTLYLDNYKN